MSLRTVSLALAACYVAFTLAGCSGNPSGGGTPTTFLVDNKVDLSVLETDGKAANTSPGLTTTGIGNAVAVFKLTNLGNNPQGYTLAVTQPVGRVDARHVEGVCRPVRLRASVLSVRLGCRLQLHTLPLRNWTRHNAKKRMHCWHRNFKVAAIDQRAPTLHLVQKPTPFVLQLAIGRGNARYLRYRFSSAILARN